LRVEVADPRGEPARETFWRAEQPWGYARVRLMSAQDTWVNVQSVRQPPLSSLPPTSGRARVELNLPDERFGACLDAQVAQLVMGLVGNETRPGDPNNYPLNWLRDGAYSPALCRARLFRRIRCRSRRSGFGPVGAGGGCRFGERSSL
jgi:hypothetical protein